jgi:outer membrane immunogenic protein
MEIRLHRHLVASLTAAGLGAALTVAARAADLPHPGPAPVYTKAASTAPSSWSGFYAGVEGGYGWHDEGSVVTPTGNDVLTSAIITGTVPNVLGEQPVGATQFGIRGAFGGVEAGYNWQLGRSWLIGVEADFNASSIKGDGGAVSLLATNVPPNVNQQFSATQSIAWFGTVRARGGWLATNNLLLYGTGGFAYGRVDETTNLGFDRAGVSATGPGGLAFTCPAGAFGQCIYGASSRIATGWAAGGGVEYRVPGTKASFKAEYQFIDLGPGDTINAIALTHGAATPSFSAGFSTTEFHTIRFGVNWGF